MTALIRYFFTVMLLSQRYLAPVLAFTGLLVILTSSDSGPLTAAYGASAGILLVSATWLTTALAGLEERTHRAVVTVNGRGHLRVLLALTATALLWCLLLTVAGLVLPLLFGSHSLTAADLLLGTEAQLVCGVTGVAIGLPCSRLLFRRQGYALVAALCLILAALLTRHVSPAYAVLSRLQNAPVPGPLLAPTAGLLTVTSGILAASVALTHVLGRRMD